MSDPYSHPQASREQYAQPGYHGQEPYSPDWRPPSASKAAMLMMIYGVLALVAIAVGALLGWEHITAVLEEVREDAAADDPEMAGVVEAAAYGGLACAFGCMALFGIAYLVLAYFVNRGSRGAAITTIVLAIISVLFTLFSLLGTVVTLASPDDHATTAMIAWSLGTDVLGLLLLAGILVFCFKLLGEVAQMREAVGMQQQAYMQQQWHEYQQQQYAQQQGQAPPQQGYDQGQGGHPPEGDRPGPEDQSGWGR